jgi:hypothetical protein
MERLLIRGRILSLLRDHGNTMPDQDGFSVSMDAEELVNLIEDEFEVVMPVASLPALPSVDDLVELVELVASGGCRDLQFEAMEEAVQEEADRVL